MGIERDEADVLIVGAGIAGLTVALSTEGRRVTILCPSLPPAATASALAQGGIAAAVGEDDDPSLHAADTIRAGRGACGVAAVQRMCAEAAPAVQWLERQGVRFDRHEGRLALHREGGHSRARVLHAGGDATGAAVTDALFLAARASPTIEFRPDRTAVALERDHQGACGVLTVDALGRPLLIRARDIVLATGGIGQLYRYTTNPPSACGDGLAMALAAGVRCRGLDLVQFHPTALVSEIDPLPLVTEALRGAGAKLIDGRGMPFMAHAHPAADLAPRDVVAREIWIRLRQAECICLDATRVFAESPDAFPTVRALCAKEGLDPAREPIPVIPAAHYHMGGVAVDAEGRSSLPCLWACGEVACTGVHGHNRLASNSLLEAVVFGRRLGAALTSAPGRPAPRTGATSLELSGDVARIDAPAWSKLRKLTWTHLGITRQAADLRQGLQVLAQLVQEVPESRSLFQSRLRLVREMMISALARCEQA